MNEEPSNQEINYKMESSLNDTSFDSQSCSSQNNEQFQKKAAVYETADFYPQLLNDQDDEDIDGDNSQEVNEKY